MTFMSDIILLKDEGKNHQNNTSFLMQEIIIFDGYTFKFSVILKGARTPLEITPCAAV